MKLTIEAEPKEIAALVLKLQERRGSEFVPTDSNSTNQKFVD